MDRIFRKRTVSGSRLGRSKTSKNKTPPVAPLPQLPPSLDIDIRSSLILPSLTERFSVLLPGLSSAPETSVRTLLAQQRNRPNGPSLTLEEEEMLFAEMQGQSNAASRGQHAPRVTESRASALTTDTWDGNPPPLEGDWGSLVDRPAGTISGSLSSPSLRENVSRSPLSPSTSDHQLSPTTSDRSLGSPPHSASYSSFNTFGPDEGRPVPRSYGFSGSQGWRDANYLRSVKKNANASKTSVATNGHGDRSHDQQASTWSSGKPTTPKRKPLPEVFSLNDSTEDLHEQRDVSQSPSSSTRTVTPTAVVTGAVVPGPTRASQASSFSQPDEPEYTTPLTTNSAFSQPRPRNQPVGGSTQQRQSLLVGITPQQAKRISLALLEIEGHLGREPTGHSSQGSHDYRHDDHEELLEGDEDDVEDGVHSIPLDRQRSFTSTSAASSVFPFSVSPASSNHGGAGSYQGSMAPRSPAGEPTPPPTVPSLPSSPQAAKDAHLDQHTPPPHNRHASPSRGRHYHSASITSTAFSGDDDGHLPQPALTPYRPQPIRATPSPAFGMSGTGSTYVPGQPRPVRSVSSAGSTPTLGSPQSPYSPPPATETLPRRLQYASPVGSAAPLPSAQTQTRSSVPRAPSTATHYSNSSISQTRIEHVPAPGVLASRHAAGHSISESLSHWRSGSALNIHSPPMSRVLSEAAEARSSYASAHSHRSSAAQTHSRSHSADPGFRSAMVTAGVVPGAAAAGALGVAATASSSSLGHTRNASLGLAPVTLRRAASYDSFSSDYQVAPADDLQSGWEPIIHESRPSEENVLLLSTGEDCEHEAEYLQQACGIYKDDLSAMQDRLMDRAKADRERQRALHSQPTSPEAVVQAPLFASPPAGTSRSLATDAPQQQQTLPQAVPFPAAQGSQVLLVSATPATSPPFPKTPSQTTLATASKPSPPRERGPPTAWKTAGAPVTVHSASSSAVHLPVDTVASTPSPLDPKFPTEHVPASELPKGPPPPRPQHPAEAPVVLPVVPTTPEAAVSKPEEEDDARHDVEMRIRQANAELFRAPSKSAHKRSLSKKQISTPTLVSTSHNQPTTPIAPSKPEEKERHLGRKMSMRWKKLVHKKSSISGADSVASGPSVVTTPPVANHKKTKSHDNTHSTPPSPKAAKHPKPPVPPLPKSPAEVTEPAVKKANPTPRSDISSFKFPYSSNGTSANGTPSDGAHKANGHGSKGGQPPWGAQSKVNVSSQSPPLKSSLKVASTDVAPRAHTPTASDSSVAESIHKFMEAGRAVGLDDDRLNNVLAQNAIRDRSATTISSSSYQSTAPTTTTYSESSRSPVSPNMPTKAYAEWAAPTSKHKAKMPSRDDFEDLPRPSFQEPGVLRRTLVVPSDSDRTPEPQATPNANPVVLPPSPQEHNYALQEPASPGLSAGSFGSTGRQNSIRRKPVQQLSSNEERERITRSPEGSFDTRDRKVSSFSVTDSEVSEVLAPPSRQWNGIPDSPRRRFNGGESARASLDSSRGGGSIYDYYSGDHGGDRGSQAVEITEYADGRVVWNIVNALRGDRGSTAEASYHEGSYHDQRESLISSGRQSSEVNGRDSVAQYGETTAWSVGPTAGLAFPRRPETRVYYTYSADVADLIDQLSSEQFAGAARGRIDIHPSTTPTADRAGVGAGGAGFDPDQFADAPSPVPPVTASRQPAVSSPLRGRFFGAEAAHNRFNAGLSGGGPTNVQSPSAASFHSSSESAVPERSVEDRLQALMDRLRSAPGGITPR